MIAQHTMKTSAAIAKGATIMRLSLSFWWYGLSQRRFSLVALKSTWARTTRPIGTKEKNAVIPMTERKPNPPSGLSPGTSTYLVVLTQNTPTHCIVSRPHIMPRLPATTKAVPSAPKRISPNVPLHRRISTLAPTYNSVTPEEPNMVNSSKPMNVNTS
ncbi:hypothetical protein DQ04_17281000 [Trypanosoma grayi]|uniref:hypothetical protein n=1 Tax=Trypanosoma grayi TaxID=71804 RepID=UPI0004F3FDDD|nr:hypothetical protein DQ04_17281000 [Trypanosoma grayi]KEG05923.1 hypothetical protein DQ04_17281000 [Trypanosoma grayi]